MNNDLGRRLTGISCGRTRRPMRKLTFSLAAAIAFAAFPAVADSDIDFRPLSQEFSK